MRKLLDRAKGLLQSEHGMSEPQAFRWIQKTSMDRRLTMRKVAEAVIEGTMGTDATGNTGGHGEGRGRGEGRVVRVRRRRALSAAVRDPGTRWYRVRLPRADTFSTWTPGSAVLTLATRRPHGKAKFAD